MSSTEAKKHPATDRKLEKQREKGSIPAATDIALPIGGAIAIAALLGLTPLIYRRLAANFDTIALSTSRPFGTIYDVAFREILFSLGFAVIPIVLIASFSTILVSVVYNKGILFALKPISPDLSRISPVTGFKRLFGRRTWIELAMGLTRLCVWFAITGVIVWSFVPSLFVLDRCGAECAATVALTVVFRLALAAIVIFVLTAAVEAVMQKNLFLHEQRMTESEVKQEQKEQTGSNEVRRERRRLRREMAENPEGFSVDHANMCFFAGDHAIAVRYHPEYAQIPLVSGRGTNAKRSAEIRRKVAENGFSELEHPGLIEALKSTPIGTPIPSEAHGQLIDALGKLFGGNT